MILHALDSRHDNIFVDTEIFFPCHLELVQRGEGGQHGLAEVEAEGVFPQRGVRHGAGHAAARPAPAPAPALLPRPRWCCPWRRWRHVHGSRPLVLELGAVLGLLLGAAVLAPARILQLP